MRTFALFLTLLCMYAAAEGRRHFGNCPKVRLADFDYRAGLGTWYVYAVNPSRWIEKCQQYQILTNPNAEYTVEESYINDYKLFTTHTTNHYDLEYQIASPKFSLRKKYIKFISVSDTWTIVGRDNTFSEYMVLYKCGPTLPWYQEEEIQVLVRDKDLVDGKTIPEDIVQAIKDAGFSVDELQFKKESDCEKK